MDGRDIDLARIRLVRRDSPLQVGLCHFRGTCLLLSVIGLGGIAFYTLGRQSLDSEICSCIQDELCQKLGPGGHLCTLGSAKLVPGQGVILNDLRIVRLGSEGPPILSVDEVSLAFDAGLGELLLKNVDVRSINVNRAHGIVHRDRDGNWNIESLVQSLVSARTERLSKPLPIRVQNSSLELRLFADEKSVAYVVRDIQCTAIPENATSHRSGSLSIRGSLAGNGVNQVSFGLDFDLAESTWTASVDASGAQIDSNMVNIVSEAINQSAPSETTFRGWLDIHCAASGRLNRPSIDGFQIDGGISNISFSDSRLPLTVRDGGAKFQVSPSAVRVWDVSVQSDQGEFDLEYAQRGPLWVPTDWRLQGNGRRLTVDRRLFPLLPESLQTNLQKWSPDGLFDLVFDVSQDESGIHPALTANLLDASFAFEKFPYRMEHCVGRVELKDRFCTIDVQSLDGDQIFRMTGCIQDPGANYSGFVDVALDGEMPLDSKLWRALEAQPRMAEVVQRFHATGNLGVTARFGRESADSKTQQDIRVRLLNGSVRHDQFDYPLHDVCGLVRIRNDRVDVDNVTAVHGNGIVRCDGAWTKTEGLKLQFLARTVSLDDQLRTALDPNSRQRWAELRPRGVVDLVQVNLVQTDPTAPSVVTVEGQIFPGGGPTETSVSIQPTWFPYSIHNVVGHITIGDGTIILDSLRGEHEQTTIACNGVGKFDSRNWELRFTDLYVRGLEADEEFLAALPADLGQAIKRIQWRGLVSARGDAVIRGDNRPVIAAADVGRSSYVSTASPRAAPLKRLPAELSWTLRLDTDNASFHVGYPLEHICGGTLISGAYDGTNLQCSGEIEVDSMMVGTAQINNIRGPLWIDQTQCAIGSLTPAASAGQTPRSVSSEFYGGQLRIDGRLSLSDDQPFFVEANVAACDMESLSDDLIPRYKNLYGTGYASVRLSGDHSGKHSWRGDGRVQLRNAQIEVPLMSAVGQVVRITDLERTVFDESNVDFDIRGDNLDLNQIEIIGLPISLIGNGKINQGRDIDLDFYTILGRNRIHIPVLSELYHASSQQFLHIKVDGELDSPQTHKTVLPGINEPLKKLLDDLEGRGPAPPKTRSPIP